MKIKEIHYEKLFNLGNYENEKIGVTVSIDNDTEIEKALILAKEIVNNECEFNQKYKEYLNHKHIIDDRKNHYYTDVTGSEEFCKNFEYKYANFLNK